MTRKEFLSIFKQKIGPKPECAILIVNHKAKHTVWRDMCSAKGEYFLEVETYAYDLGAFENEI